MCAKIGHFAASEVQKRTKIEILSGVPIAVFHRSEEAHPVEIGRLLARFGGQRPFDAAVPDAPGVRDLAQQPAIDEALFGLQIDRAGTLLHAHLADLIVDARGLDDLGPSSRRRTSGFSQ
jgi:hypothetical protein